MKYIRVYMRMSRRKIFVKYFSRYLLFGNYESRARNSRAKEEGARKGGKRKKNAKGAETYFASSSEKTLFYLLFLLTEGTLA